MVNVFKFIKCFVKVPYNQRIHLFIILASVYEIFLISYMLILQVNDSWPDLNYLMIQTLYWINNKTGFFMVGYLKFDWQQYNGQYKCKSSVKLKHK